MLKDAGPFFGDLKKKTGVEKRSRKLHLSWQKKFGAVI
jgi:hypothetical protein